MKRMENAELEGNWIRATWRGSDLHAKLPRLSFPSIHASSASWPLPNRFQTLVHNRGSGATPSMAVSLQSTSLRPLALDPKRSLSLTSKSFVGLKSQSSGAFAYGPPNVSSGFHCRVHQSLSFRHPTKRGSQGRIFMMPIGTPRVPYRTPGEGTWQWVDLWNALYRERVIFIGEHIDEEFCNQVLATMLYLDSIESSKKLYLYINGPGGDLTPSMAIYDTMQSLKSPVATHCIGHAYNMAGFLLAAGEKGSRVGMPLCRVTLQPPAGAARGQADDIRNEANELLRIRDYLFGELAKKTGQPVEKINKDLSYVKRFNAQEALEYGLIDRILRPARIKADAPRKETAQQGQA